MRPFAFALVLAAIPAAAPAEECTTQPDGALSQGCMIRAADALAAEAHRLAGLVVADTSLPQTDRDAAADAPDPTGSCGDDYACATRAWTGEIAHLRMTYKAAQDNAPGSLSLGPYTFDCSEGDPVTAVFVSGLAPAMWLSSGGGIVLPEAFAASGARYATEDGGTEFWDHHGEASLTLPGQQAATCTVRK